MSYLTFKHVDFKTDDKLVLNDINFAIDEGDFVSIVGPSGSGKSTVLKLASGLMSPTAGHIFFDGKDLNQLEPVESRKMISYCFQTPHLFGNTVEDNISFPYHIRHEKVDYRRVDNLFQRFEMDQSYLKQDVKKLSGGEKQRIALIRQLLFEPKVLLLDEVTSALDNHNKAIVEKVIKSLHDKGITILWITHDEEQSRRFANKVLKVVNGSIEAMEVIK
ncbi:ABC transporter ATP-binding protein [Streptococcus agalactiae]|uniref:ABC transporter ATP-binding protein n=1 Tax=Streptococcus agalactiae TaxID=1311 RepID=UPI0030ECF366